MKRSFEIYGIGLEISCAPEFPSGAKLLEWIAEDFSYFEKSELDSSPEIVFSLMANSSSQEELPSLLPAFKTRMCKVSGWGAKRFCDYGENTRVFSEIDKKRRSFRVYCGKTELAYEALYSAVLSSVGESLDRKGFHRVHALGIAISGKSALLLLPTGGGKSAVAALLHQTPDVRIFSDESPLIRRGRIYPFPVRGALKPEVARAIGVPGSGRVFRRKLFPEKILIPFQAEKVAEPSRVDWILIGNMAHRDRTSSPARIQASLLMRLSGKIAALPIFLENCVVGWGLAQMSEYMIRADSLFVLPRIALGRLLSCLGLVFRSKVALMDVSADARQNASALAEFLSDFPNRP